MSRVYWEEMEKARSRLKSAAPTKTQPTTERKPLKPVSAPKQLGPILTAYLSHLPTLVMAVICFGVVYFIFTKVRPETIRHFIVPNSYLPLLLPVFLGNLFLWSLVFLNTRRGALISCLITVLLFLKLQLVVLTSPIVIGLAGSLLLIELMITAFSRKRPTR